MRWKYVKWAIVTLCLLAALAGTFYFGATFGRIYENQKLVYEFHAKQNLAASFRRAAHLQPSYGQFQQDLWVALAEAPGKKDGYYVDVGSADGVVISNTYLLDQMGWKGVCIDPFPRNMQQRTCQLFKQPVFSVSGKKLQFRVAGDLGGLETDLGEYKESLSKAPAVELVTATLDEILEKAKAPKWIDYMNIDVEGAEFDVLRGFSLDRYEVGAFTIEHNFEAEKRENIRRLLTSKGYVRVRSMFADDWYVHRDHAAKYSNYLAYGPRMNDDPPQPAQ